MDKKKLVVDCLKLLYKALPFLIAVLGGAGVAAVAGCKCGSLLSIVAPAI